MALSSKSWELERWRAAVLESRGWGRLGPSSSGSAAENLISGDETSPPPAIGSNQFWTVASVTLIRRSKPCGKAVALALGSLYQSSVDEVKVCWLESVSQPWRKPRLE